MGYVVAYEPAIPGTGRKSDLLVDDGKSPWLVETTVVLRADADKAWERYEETVWHRLRGGRAPEQRYLRAARGSPTVRVV